MNQLICDRCGKVIEKPTKRTFRLFTVFHMVHFSLFSPSGDNDTIDEGFDLCGNCAEILWDWLRKPKEE